MVNKWRTSSHSISGECVEVSQDDTEVLIRDTKARDSVILMFPAAAWRVFMRAVSAK